MHPVGLLAFWLTVLALVAVPGADWAFVLGIAARGRPVTPAVVGLALGYLLLSGVVAVGLGALVADSPRSLAVITIAGSGYLLALGVGLLRARKGGFDERREAAPHHPAVALLQGVGVSALNPKGVLIVVALLPQFAVAEAEWPVPVQLAVLGLVFSATVAGFYLVLGAASARVLRSRQATARILSRASGAAMVIVGAVLLASGMLELAG